MSGKIEISRDQAEVLISIIDPRITDRATIWTLQSRIARVIDEVKDILAAQVVDRQPVAWMALNRDGFPEKCLSSDPEGFPVYREQPAPVAVADLDVDQLAQIIRAVDGNHSLGAGALAERILDKVKELNQ